MKKIILFFLLSIGTTVYAQQAITTFILTRHAEKENDGTKDPDLSQAGNERAESLLRMLSKTKVDAIYSTHYKRTRNTVMPLAQAKGLTITAYDGSKTEEMDQILTRHSGATILICGHSNNIPSIVNYLTGKDEYRTFDDTDYSNLIIVTVIEKGKTTKVTWLNY